MYTPHVPEPSYVNAIYKMRQEEVLKEVEHRRMLKLIRSMKQSIVERVMLAVGKFMIATGESIRERYAPLAAKSCEHYSTRYMDNMLGYEPSSDVSIVVKTPHDAMVFTEKRCATLSDDTVQDIFSVSINPSIRS